MDTAQPQRVRLRLDVAYDGTDFHGWAKQFNRATPDASRPRTVQEELEDRLSTIAREPVELVVAGRTDAGVHALAQVAHVDVPAELLQSRSLAGDPSRLVTRLNKMLDGDIQVRDVQLAPPGFDARFSALRRHYVYRLTCARAGAHPLRRRDTAEVRRELDIEVMQQVADRVVGLHDFAGFCKAKPHATTIRTLQYFQWEDISTASEPQLYQASISADAFCWNMVRALVGACIEVARGAEPVEFVDDLLARTSRSPRLRLAPAKGLALAGVDYPASVEELSARTLVTKQRRDDPQR
ncbi:tRNA pseudouridine(38-40) synthase TruA [Corynebacterium ciconiae]|uniref:tRNA pseudouridine(38-40) synthase TruA n=1 Tax=Corynebacterium ciconiae TaxID=227319 RepID=UPI00035FDD41|nr:tRNA pseudouridine(38-40) synthase TruA [Corynebacterium ciconiae]